MPEGLCVCVPVRLQCSVTCGQGKATRQVVCVNFSDQAMDASECDPDDRPVTEQECSMPHCPRRPEPLPKKISPPPSGRNQWRTGPWGAVSLPRSCLLVSVAVTLDEVSSLKASKEDVSCTSLLLTALIYSSNQKSGHTFFMHMSVF